MKEATMTISGVQLTEAQSMTVRVAIGNMLIMMDPDYKQSLGPIGDLYELRLNEINDLIALEAR